MKAKLIIPILTLLVACNSGNKTMSPAMIEKVKAEAKGVVNNYFECLKINDSLKLLSMTDDRPDFTLIFPSSGVMNNVEFKNLVRQMLPTVASQSFITKSEKYTILSLDMFIYTWYGDNGMKFKNETSMMLDDYIVSETFRKIDGVWKIIFGVELSKVPTVPDPVALFTGIEEAWLKALKEKDEKAMNALFADEYLFTDNQGGPFSKAESIQSIMKTDPQTLNSMTFSDIKVNIYDKIAVVKGLSSASTISAGKKTISQNHFTDIFIFREGRWQCVSTDAVPAPKK